MIGILVQLVICWLLLWVFEKKNLEALGFKPTKRRLRDFLVFFMVAIGCGVSGYLLRMWIAHFRYELNPELHAELILQGIWFTIKSVLFEELIFRGALLYILIKRMGVNWGIIISSVAFGMYHWFSHEAWGNPQQMIIEFLTTGSIGVLLAYGFAKSGSIYIPVALHLGWNVAVMVIFSGNTIGPQLFTEILPRKEVTISYFSFYVMIFLPLIAHLVINGWLLRRYRKVEW